MKKILSLCLLVINLTTFSKEDKKNTSCSDKIIEESKKCKDINCKLEYIKKLRECPEYND